MTGTFANSLNNQIRVGGGRERDTHTHNPFDTRAIMTAKNAHLKFSAEDALA